jgi:RNA polymerase sigma-70 factor (ECF subfamily)
LPTANGERALSRLAYNPRAMASTEPALESLGDEQLVTAYRAGRDAAFELLVERYRTELVQFLVRFVSSRPAAEDLFQETFLQVHQSLHTFDSQKRFKPWLFTIAANKARDYLRKYSRRQAAAGISTVADDDDPASGRAIIDLLEADLPLPPENVEGQETRQQVRQTIEGLPTHLREVLLLAYFNQFAYKEIAEMLSLPLGTVKSRLHAAVGTFAELWKQSEAPRARGQDHE